MSKKLFVNKQEVNWRSFVSSALTATLCQIPNGALIGIRCGDKPAFIALFRLCLELDLVPVILSGDFDDGIRDRLYLLIDAESPGISWCFSDVSATASDPSVAYICQTSGSVGKRKFVVIAKAAIHYQAESLSFLLGYKDSDTVGLPITPWSAYGLSILVCWALGKVNLAVIDKISPSHIFDSLRALDVSIFDATPQIYVLLAKFLAENGAGFVSPPSVRIWSCGGDLLSPALAQGWLETVKMPILDGYGQSEATVNIALNTPHCYEAGTVGKPIPGTEVRIHPDTGEILVKTPSLMAGYWDNSEATAMKITCDGWLRTGDIGEITESGALRITGRLDNQVKVNGMLINLETVESVLLSHHAVAGAAVTAILLKSGLIKLKAYIAPSDDSINLHEVKQFTARLLDTVFRPKEYVLVQSIPLNANGKIDRAAVAKL
jgi:long-subunit acyl-CoA synthetase (AMP-forming)